MLDISRIIFSFLLGGFICVIAQLLIDLTKLTPARILVLYVSLGVLLGGIGLYDPLFKFAGAGISVPLVGFGANLAKGVMEEIDKVGLIGIFTGPFSSASVGCTAAIVFGYLSAIIFKSKPKQS